VGIDRERSVRTGGLHPNVWGWDGHIFTVRDQINPTQHQLVIMRMIHSKPDSLQTCRTAARMAGVPHIRSLMLDPKNNNQLTALDHAQRHGC
jgi:hypothetical protein